MILDGVRRAAPSFANSLDFVGCEKLLKAVTTHFPRIHCFGHVHEMPGAATGGWVDGNLRIEKVIPRPCESFRHVKHVSLCADDKYGLDLSEGEETLFVNASIMDIQNKPRHYPWVVDLELPLTEDADDEDFVVVHNPRLSRAAAPTNETELCDIFVRGV